MNSHREHLNSLRNQKDLQAVIKINKNKDKNILRGSMIYENLSDCRSSDKKGTELFIVEGASAGGTVIKARLLKKLTDTVGVLFMRGKSLNVPNYTFKEASQNKEIIGLINAFGCGVDKDFDIDRLRYDKIILLCFTRDTKVKSLDGNSYSFGELEDKGIDSLWVYSVDKKGNIVPALANFRGSTRSSKKKAIVTLDSGGKIECTPDHKFMLRNGEYKEAQHLKKGESLMPLYLREDSKGYFEYFNNRTRKWSLVHRLVNKTINLKEHKEKIKNNVEKFIQTHHKDHNPKNNVPENLEWLTKEEHAKYHMVHYNKSPERIVYIKQLHEDGHYDHTYFGQNGYNGSEKHINAVKAAWRCEGKVKLMKQSLINYNKSDKHKETVRQMNADPEINKLQVRGRMLKRGRKILDEGKDIYETISSGRNRARDIKVIISNFGSIENFVESSKHYNHKVLNVEIIDLDKEEKFYCLNVPEYGNFFVEDSLGNTICCRNSDSDPDGAEVSSIMLGNICHLFPETIYSGHVYVCETPLHVAVCKKDYIPLYNESFDRSEYTAKGYRITRLKGLGEAQDEWMASFCFDKSKRKLIQITSDNVEDVINITTNKNKAKVNYLRDEGIL
jgi:hypothetical protein